MNPIAEIRLAPSTSRNSMWLEAFHGGHCVGSIEVYRHRGRVRGKVVWVVAGIRVAERLRRKGIAAALYAAALNEVCRRRGHLISVGPRVNATNAFWEKQVAVGVAKKFKFRVAPVLGWSSTRIFYIADCPPRRRTSRSS